MSNRTSLSWGSLIKKRSDVPGIKHPPTGHAEATKILLRKKRYPDAGVATSVPDLSGLDDEEFAYQSRMILMACMNTPGAMVYGAEKFITGDSEDEAVEFLVAAGFPVDVAKRIAPPGWSLQFSARYQHLHNHEAATEFPDNLAESEIGSCCPRDNEGPV